MKSGRKFTYADSNNRKQQQQQGYHRSNGDHHERVFKIEQQYNRMVFRPSLSCDTSFYDFVVDSNRVLAFFRGLVEHVEMKRGIKDYHINLKYYPNSFIVTVLYGKPNQGPHKTSQCMSCDLTCPLSLGIHGEEPDEHFRNNNNSVNKINNINNINNNNNNDVNINNNNNNDANNINNNNDVNINNNDVKNNSNSDRDNNINNNKNDKSLDLTSQDSLLPFGNEGFVRCWLDGKGRHMYIVTPLRHVSALRELTDEQLVVFWQTAVRLLEAEGVSQFKTMILNHGKYMNHGHLHLKIAVSSSIFFKNKTNWSLSRQQQWEKIISFNKPQEHQILQKYKDINSVFVTGLSHTELGVDFIKDYFERTFGKVLYIAPLQTDSEAMIVHFERKEVAVKCMVEGFGTMIEGFCPQFRWSHR